MSKAPSLLDWSLMLQLARQESAAPPDDDPFEQAVRVFHRVYRHAYRPVLASEAQEAHDEATREALEAFLGTYVELVTR